MPRSSGFRIQRKAVGLTYSCPRNDPRCQQLTAPEHVPDCDCKNPLSQSDILIKLEQPGCDWLIGRELHQNGTEHYHVYIKYADKLDISDPRHFDIFGVHPNIIDGIPGKGWMAYCAKHKDYDSNFWEVNSWTTALAQPTAEEAITFLWQKEPMEMCKNAHNIINNINKRLRSVFPRTIYEGPYQRHFYPAHWNPKTHSLLITGPAGVGKTQFAKYIFGDHEYVKGSLEGLRRCTFTKPIIFDEISMLGKDPEQSKEITDVENGGTISMRYNDVEIPPGVPRIFLHNISHPFRDPNNAVYDRRVISYRPWDPPPPEPKSHFDFYDSSLRYLP